MKLLSKITAIALLLVLAALPAPSRAQDKVTVGVFPISSSLPYFVAIERGSSRRRTSSRRPPG